MWRLKLKLSLLPIWRMWNWTWYSCFSEKEQLDLEKFQDVLDRSILTAEAANHGNGQDQSRGIKRKEKAIYHPLWCGNKSGVRATLFWRFFDIIVCGGVSALDSTLTSDSAWKIDAFLKIDQNLFRPLTPAQTDMCALKPQFWESRFQSASCDQRNDLTFYHLFYQHVSMSFLLSVLVNRESLI